LRKKQKESGWSKYVFLSSLRDVHTDYLAGLTRQINNERKLNPDIDELRLGLSIESETNGKIKEVHVDYGKRANVINRDVLQMLIEAIDRAYDLDEPKAQYSDFQIITLFETALRFIKDEFEVQAGIKEDTLPFTRSAPKGFTSKTEKGEKVYLLHFYHIKGPEPILDFKTFKHAIRNLLISSPHPERLDMMLKPRIDEVKEVVRIWNDILQPLDAGIGNAVTYRRLIEFQTKKEDWTIWYDAKITSFQENSTRYTNYDLVRFAFDAGNLIANEIVEEEKKEEIKSKGTAKAKYKKQTDDVKPPEQPWKGTNEQKEKLYNGLVSYALLRNEPQTKSNFLSGSPIQWLGSFVLLIFLIENLKPKYINSFAHLQNIVHKNFIGKNNEPFGSTRQSKYNMGNNKKDPKGAEIIKSIIDTLQ
jgi:hypothetical protein